MLNASLNFPLIRTPGRLGLKVLQKVLRHPRMAHISKALRAGEVDFKKNVKALLITADIDYVLVTAKGSFDTQRAVEQLAAQPRLGLQRSFYQGLRIAHTKDDSFWVCALEDLVLCGPMDLAVEGLDLHRGKSVRDNSPASETRAIHDQPPNAELQVHIEPFDLIRDRVGHPAYKLALSGLSELTLTLELDAGLTLRLRAPSDSPDRATFAARQFGQVLDMIAKHPGARTLGLAPFAKEHARFSTDDNIVKLDIEIPDAEKAVRFINTIEKVVVRLLTDT